MRASFLSGDQEHVEPLIPPPYEGLFSLRRPGTFFKF
jgi:hypothetical protein